jgi:gamma-glutamylcyclotransferase
MYYFAYASNLNRKQMAERCPEAKAKLSATLPNYKLIFSGYSRERKGAPATIMYSKGDKVLGGVYEITEVSLRKLDRWEDLTTYKHLNVTVWTDGGDPVEAVTYARVKQAEEDKPSPEYLAVIQQGYRDWGII